MFPKGCKIGVISFWGKIAQEGRDIMTKRVRKMCMQVLGYYV